VIVLLNLILGYMIGGLPTGLLLCRIVKGEDPRAHGSGSTGATNVSRVLGKKWAVLVLIIDILKGFLPVKLLVPLISPDSLAWGMLLMAVGLVAGHVWTPYAGFRGGKGVATAAGAILGIDPLALLIALSIWVLFFLPFRIVSLASMTAAISLPFIMFILGGRPAPALIAAILLAGFIVFTHRANIQRLIKGEEKRF